MSPTPTTSRVRSRLVPFAVALALVGLGLGCTDEADAAAGSGAGSAAADTGPTDTGPTDVGPGGVPAAVLDLDLTAAGFSVHLGSVTETSPGDFAIDGAWTNLETDREAQVQVPTFVDVAGEDPISVVRTSEVVAPQDTVADTLTFSLPEGLPLGGAFLRFGEEDQEAVRFSLTDPDAAELGAFDPIAVEAPAGATGSTFDYTVDDVQLRRDDLFRHEQAPLDARALLVTLTVTVLDDGLYGTDGNILPAEQELVLADGSVVHGDGGLGVPIPFTSNLLDGTTATGTLLFILEGHRPGPVTLRLTADDPAVEIPLELP